MYNIKMDLRWSGMDRIDLAEDRDKWRALVNTVMNLRVLQNAGKFSSVLEPRVPAELAAAQEGVSCAQEQQGPRRTHY
jgi:hypothetical protein